VSAGESSVVVRMARAIGRTFRSIDNGLARAAAERNAADDADGARVRRIIRDSRVVQFVDGLFAAPERAWRHSKSREIVIGAVSTINALELPQRVRLFGWMALVAIVTRGGIFVMTGNTPSSVTLAFWGVLAGVGAFMMAAPRQVAAAWLDWRQRGS
jgi:hypothetical protein